MKMIQKKFEQLIRLMVVEHLTRVERFRLEPVWGPCAIVPILVKYSILSVSISTQNYNKITKGSEE